MKRRLSIVYSMDSNPRINFISKIRLTYNQSYNVDYVIHKCESIISKYYSNQNFTIHFLIELDSGFDFITYKGFGYNIRTAKNRLSKSSKEYRNNYSDRINYHRNLF